MEPQQRTLMSNTGDVISSPQERLNNCLIICLGNPGKWRLILIREHSLRMECRRTSKKCAHKYTQQLMCGHCEMTVDHLNVKGRHSDLPCKPEYRIKPTAKQIFSKMAMTPRTHSLLTLWQGVKTTATADTYPTQV